MDHSVDIVNSLAAESRFLQIVAINRCHRACYTKLTDVSKEKCMQLTAAGDSGLTLLYSYDERRK